jgi:hypothetical protein
MTTQATFGVASVGRVKRDNRGRVGKKYDCGSHGRLAITDICLRTGLSWGAVWSRINKQGWRGEKLLMTAHEARSYQRVNRPPHKPVMVTALRIAMQFPGRVPTVAEIQQVRPMSTAHAEKWRAAIARARIDALPQRQDGGE